MITMSIVRTRKLKPGLKNISSKDWFIKYGKFHPHFQGIPRFIALHRCCVICQWKAKTTIHFTEILALLLWYETELTTSLRYAGIELVKPVSKRCSFLWIAFPVLIVLLVQTYCWCLGNSVLIQTIWLFIGTSHWGGCFPFNCAFAKPNTDLSIKIIKLKLFHKI